MGILLKNVTLHDLLKFMEVNIRSNYTPSELELMCDGRDPALTSGLLRFRSLLKSIYSAGEYLEGKDNEAKFNSLYETMLFFYTCTVFGELASRDSQQTIVIDKEVLLSKYKRGRLSIKIRLLEQHGLVLEWLSSNGNKTSQRKAAVLSLTFPQDEHLISAIKYLAVSINAIEPIDQSENDRKRRPYHKFSFESISDKLEIFSKADFKAAFLNDALPRRALDPLREDVIATMGKYGQQWVYLVDKLVNQYNLECFGSFYIGQWGVSFHKKRQRPFLIFSITYERLGIELTVPVDTAERIIKQRKTYSKPIQDKIEAFHCMQCPKECKGKNLTKIDGVTLCTGRAEARRIYMEITTDQDWDSIEAIADTAFT